MSARHRQPFVLPRHFPICFNVSIFLETTTTRIRYRNRAAHSTAAAMPRQRADTRAYTPAHCAECMTPYAAPSESGILAASVNRPHIRLQAWPSLCNVKLRPQHENGLQVRHRRHCCRPERCRGSSTFVDQIFSYMVGLVP